MRRQQAAKNDAQPLPQPLCASPALSTQGLARAKVAAPAPLRFKDQALPGRQLQLPHNAYPLGGQEERMTCVRAWPSVPLWLPISSIA